MPRKFCCIIWYFYLNINLFSTLYINLIKISKVLAFIQSMFLRYFLKICNAFKILLNMELVFIMKETTMEQLLIIFTRIKKKDLMARFIFFKVTMILL